MEQWVARGNVQQISYNPRQNSICPSGSHAPSGEFNYYVHMHVYVCTCVHARVCMRVCVCMRVHMCMCGCLHDHACLLATNLCEFPPQTNVVDLGGFCTKVGGEVHEEARH